MTNLIATIGRGIGDSGAQLSHSQWRAFRESVLRNMRAGEVVFYGDGFGQWEGQREQAYSVTAIVDDEQIASIQSAILAVASRYGQDAVAFTVADADIRSTEVPAKVTA